MIMTKAFTTFVCVYTAFCWTLFGVSARSVTPEFEPYVKEYYRKVEANCHPDDYNSSPFYQIKFKPQVDGIIGLCYQKINGYRIEIDPDWWNDPWRTEADRKQLMDHELAHCVIYRPHSDNAQHYMYPSHVNLSEQVENAQVLEDIVNRCN